ncbi:MAG: hypothetical protein RR221_06895 [Alistipes sp.]
MSKKSIDQLKRYFKKGAYPTEAQFVDVFDSLRHKDDGIAINDVDKLADQLNSKYSAADGAATTAQAASSVENIVANKLAADREFIAIRKTLSELSMSGSVGSMVLSGKEHIVGSFEDETGAIHDVYENVFSLANLPTIVSEAKEYELSAEPLGFGLYISVVSLEMVSTNGGTFHFGKYNIDRVFVFEQKTKCEVRCIAPVAGCTEMVLRMRYIKYMGDKLSFSLTLPSGVSAGDVSLSAAPLKYDKRFAFTYTADDSVVGAYARIFKRINKKWIDDVEFAHMNQEPTTGVTPENALCITDGCGNDRRFGFSCAIWPTWGNEYSPNGFIKDSSTSKTNPYITWEELKLMVDYGISLCYHNVDERIYDKNTPAKIARGFVDDNLKTYEKTGRYMKILGLPDGNSAYVDAADLSSMVVFMRSSLHASSKVNLHTCGLLKGLKTYGGTNSSDITAKLAELATQHVADNPYWTGITSHRVSLEMMEMMATIHGLYGKGGDDSIWVASWDEIYEYVTMREGMTVKKTVNKQTVTFDVYVPSGRAFYFRELSFLVTGIPSMDGVTLTPLSENIKGESHAIHVSRWKNDKVLLVNMNFNKTAVALATNATAKYEASAELSDKDDALYFTSMLLPSLAAPLTARIDNVAPGVPGGLRLISTSINTGAALTTNRATTVTLDLTGSPTHYRVSESEAFDGAGWQSYSVPYIPYMLSDVLGKKTVYVQLKDASTQTAVVSDTIILEASDIPIQIVLNSITINGGAASTATRDVAVAINTNLAPTHYRIGEVADLSAQPWVTYTGNATYTLSQNNGQKTIYAQVKNADGHSETKFAVIALSQTTSGSMRAILSLGWDWSSGGSTGTTVYDAAMQLGKVRLGADGISYNIYDTNGNIVGTADIAGLKTTGSTNTGNTTGNGTGVYPDNVLKWSGYKPAATSEASVSMALATPGTYKFKIFVNTKNQGINITGSTYALVNGSSVQNYAMRTYNIKDNYTNVLELTTTITVGTPVILKLSTSDTGNDLLLINAIEIEKK